MANKKKSGSNFLVQGSILAMASIICRIIGLLYQFPMRRKLGEVGINCYTSAYDIYNIALIISSFSIPTAVSKLVSTYRGKNNRKMIYHILRGSLLFAIIVGGITSLVVFFGAPYFTTHFLKTPNAVYALQVLAPVLFVVAILGVIRGFFQGMGTMIPSAISQIIEQIINAVVSVVATYIFYDYGAKVGAVLGKEDYYAASYAAAGGTLGTAMGAVFALLFLLFILMLYLQVFKKKMYKEKHSKVESYSYITYILIMTIIPVLLSTTVYNISDIIDNSVFKNISVLQDVAKTDFGTAWSCYANYRLLINVPIAIAAALAASSVPALTRVFQTGNIDVVKKQIESSLRFIMVVAFPSAVGLGVLAKPFFTIIFPQVDPELTSNIMYVGAIAVIFYGISTVTNGSLQGIDRMKAPVKNATISLVIHVVLLLLFLLVFKMGIYAVVVSNALFSLFVCILNGFDLYRYIGFRQEITKTFVIPGLCSVIMGICTYLVYFLLYKVTEQLLLSTLVACVVAVLVYAITILLFKGITEDEIKRFPGGTKLAVILKRAHLL